MMRKFALGFNLTQEVLAATSKVENWCLDVARELQQIGGDNQGQQVVAWPECHEGDSGFLAQVFVIF